MYFQYDTILLAKQTKPSVLLTICAISKLFHFLFIIYAWSIGLIVLKVAEIIQESEKVNTNEEGPTILYNDNFKLKNKDSPPNKPKVVGIKSPQLT